MTITNANGVWAGSLTVIQTQQPNFHLTLHLRDKEQTETYQVTATLYYTPSEPALGRMVVHTLATAVDVTQPGAEYHIEG